MPSSEKLTEEIRREIFLQYGSLRHFCLQNNLSLSTLGDMLKNGVGSSRYQTVFQVCCLLHLPLPVIGCGQEYRCAELTAEKLSRLDQTGVKNVLKSTEGMNRM